MFYLKLSRCLLAQRQLEYLGHIVSSSGIAPDPSKISAMVDWPTPTTIKALRGYLSLIGFYRKYFKAYASIAYPLTSLLRKDSFKWSPQAQSAFKALKHAITEAPVLALPDFSIPFTLETNASASAIGAVLRQHNHPIAFFSKSFCPRLLKVYTYVRKLHAITIAVKKWRQYLLGHPFIILMDHKSLKELMSRIVQTPEQQVYLSKLLGHDYSIQYKSGKQTLLQTHYHTSRKTILGSVSSYLCQDSYSWNNCANLWIPVRNSAPCCSNSRMTPFHILTIPSTKGSSSSKTKYGSTLRMSSNPFYWTPNTPRWPYGISKTLHRLQESFFLARNACRCQELCLTMSYMSTDQM